MKTRGSMKATRFVAIMGCLALLAAIQPSSAQDDRHVLAIPMTVKLADVKWTPMFPELGDRSPQISILRIDPVTQATQLLVRIPKNFHVPMHWHAANEMYTILRGEFSVSCNGKREDLGRGDFNYIPSKIPHEAWTKKGALLFITADRPWNLNWVGDPPTQAEMLEAKKGGD